MSNFPEDTLPKALRKELELARLIQQSTYPSRIPAVERYTTLGDTKLAGCNNGDFYDAIGIIC